MKKIVTLAFVLLIGTTAMAQGTWGVQAGYSTKTLSTEIDTISDSFKNDLTYGMFFRYSFGRLYVQPEITLYDIEVKQPEQQSLDDITLASFTRFNMTVPLLFGLRIIGGNDNGLRVMGGPTFNYHLENFVITKNEWKQAFSNFKLDNMSAGFQGGVGIDLLGFITIDVKYNFDPNKVVNTLGIEDEVPMDEVTVEDTHMNMYSVTVGIKF